MVHELDNPIWTALTTGNRDVAITAATARYMQRNMGWFAAMPRYTKAGFHALWQVLPKESGIILFVPRKIGVPAGWKTVEARPLLQMVYTGGTIKATPRAAMRPLTPKHVPAMLRLTALTRPGPFFRQTIRLGNYEGIFAGRRLVAMSGRRLHAGEYIEVSAVCTRPGHTGKGYAQQLLVSQVNSIVGEGKTPMLHVFPENERAISVYKKLGFTIRARLLVYFLQREQDAGD